MWTLVTSEVYKGWWIFQGIENVTTNLDCFASLRRLFKIWNLLWTKPCMYFDSSIFNIFKTCISLRWSLHMKILWVLQYGLIFLSSLVAIILHFLMRQLTYHTSRVTTSMSAHTSHRWYVVKNTHFILE